MRKNFALIPLLLALSTRARADDSVLPPEPCANSAALDFEDAPSTRLGDPNEVAKQLAGMSPLQTKRVEIDATDTEIAVRLITHSSFEDFWAYAQRRAQAGAPIRGAEGGGRVLGPLTTFNITPKNHPEKAIQIRAWLEYDSPSVYRPRVHVATPDELAATMPVTADRVRPLPKADLSSPIDITLGLNEAELRIPVKNFDFDADEELVFHFRKGDAVVCVPEQD